MGLVIATFKSQSHKIVGSTLIYEYQKSWYFELSNNYYCILIQWSMVQEWSVLTLSAMQCKTVVFWGKLNISWTEPYYDFAHKAGVQMNPLLFKSPQLGAPHPKNAAHSPTRLFLFFFVKIILSKFNTDALMVLVDMSGHSGWLPLLLQTCSGKWCRRMKGCFIMKSSSLTSSFSLGGILVFFLFQADEFEL